MELKMFNCTTCGPVETCYIHGEWVDKAYLDMVFEVTRPTFDTYNAKVAEHSQRLPGELAQPRVLADIEDYAENTRKFQCATCGKIFSVNKRINDPTAVSGTPTAAMRNPVIQQAFQAAYGRNPGAMAPAVNAPTQAMYQLFDNKFTDVELDFMLTDVGEDPNNFQTRQDKIDHLLSRIY